jgi:hypothetical protein
VRRPAGEQYRDGEEGGDREHHEDAGVEAESHEVRYPRHGGVDENRWEVSEQWRYQEQHLVDARRHEVFLAQKLQRVGERL